MLQSPVVADDVPGSEDLVTLDLSVEEAVSLALVNNIQLSNSRIRRSVDRFALKIAEREFHPYAVTQAFSERDAFDRDQELTGIDSSIRLRVQTGGEIALGSRVTRSQGSAQTPNSHAGSVDLTFKQPLLRGAGLSIGRSSLQTARIYEEISVLAFKSALMNLITDVIRTYRSHIRARRQSEIAMRSLERSEDLLEVNQLLVETGRMAEQDVVQAEADLALRQLNLVASEGTLDSTRLALIDVLDLATDTEFGELSTLDPSQIGESNPELDAALVIALNNRPDFLSSELSVQEAMIRSKVAQNNRLWDLSLTLGWTFSGKEDDLSLVVDNLSQTGERVSLDLAIPIGPAASGTAELEYRRAKASLQIAKNSLADLRQQIAIDVKNSLRNTEIASQRLELATRALVLADQKAKIEREKLSLGVTTNFQLVAFENDLVIAETGELNAIVDFLNAISDLDEALGTTLERWNVDIESVDSMEESLELSTDRVQQ